MTAFVAFEIKPIFIRVTFSDGSLRQSSQKKGCMPTGQ